MSAKKEKKIGIARLRKETGIALSQYQDTLALGIIIEMNDPLYYQRRVIELLRENEQIPIDDVRRDNNLKLSINLLAATLASRDFK